MPDIKKAGYLVHPSLFFPSPGITTTAGGSLKISVMSSSSTSVTPTSSVISITSSLISYNQKREADEENARTVSPQLRTDKKQLLSKVFFTPFFTGLLRS